MKAILVLAIVLVAPSASAQEKGRVTLGSPSLELDYSTLEREGEQYRLREEYRAINLGPPAAGIVVSTIGMLAGPFLAIIGSFESFCLCEDPEPLSAGARAMVATGTIMTFGGFAGLIASSVVLAKKKRRRKWLASQLDP